MVEIMSIGCCRQALSYLEESQKVEKCLNQGTLLLHAGQGTDLALQLERVHNLI